MQTVMILDDAVEDRFFARRALKRVLPECAMHEFAYADDALGFLRSPERPNFDLLFVDINMPRMTGFEFAEAYAELYSELRGKAPLYIVTGSVDPEDQVRAEKLPGVTGFLEKPVTREKIEKIVAVHQS